MLLAPQKVFGLAAPLTVHNARQS